MIYLSSELFKMCQDCYLRIKEVRKCPLLVYAANFLIASPVDVPNFIELSDVDGFTDLVQSITNNKEGVDVLLHSPGGRVDATERIVYILRNRF